jgi:ubiquitin carboxyl-terminal hydrolase L5
MRDERLTNIFSPVYGVIFLFKYPTNEPAAQNPNPGQPLDGSFDYTAAENLFFAAQVIQNACGTQAILSVLLNKTASSAPQPTDQASPETIDVGPALTEFKEFTGAFPADIRGEALSNSELIRTVHNSFAKSSPFIDETPRDANAESEDVYVVFE